MAANRLAGEKSPYLLQHAHNPVDWYPWGPEAFARAKKEDKPLLLSIGYSTCHWCHVMERESFEDEAIAKVMNEHFVCVKLDREERPDVDKVYMTAVQAMTGRGGWPLNAFLTPDLKPFFGGTYFPPEPRWGQPGWPQLLGRIAQLWKERKADILGDAEKLSAAIKELTQAKPAPGEPSRDLLERALKGLEGSFDPTHAGFGGAPKFPMPGYLSLLLRLHSRGHKEAKRLALDTLRAMAAGGLCDQAGGGFHRYSTDSEWRVPHFEKMLYDNAQLAAVYAEAYQAFGEEDLAQEARGALDYMLRDLTHPDGAFFSAEDADSLPAGENEGEKKEGAFYLWTHAEITRLLGDDASLFCYRFGCRPDGNAVADPHGEFDGANILYRARTVEQAAGKFGLKPEEADQRLKAALAKLLDVRAKRPRPGLDDKVLASWNGLAISSFAKAGTALGEKKYLDAARSAASFIKEHLWDDNQSRLWHRYRDGQRAVPGMADDYLLLGLGLVDLYEASLEPEWLAWAVRLAEESSKLFSDKDGGFYLTAEGDAPELIARVMDDSDGVEPCASSAGAWLLLRLAALTGRKDFDAAARRALSRFSSRLGERPLSLAVMLCALDFGLDKPMQVAIAGNGAQAAALWAEVRKRFLPRAVFLNAGPALSKLAPWAAEMKPVNGRAAAYVCADGACQNPVAEPAALGRLLDA